MTYLEKIPFTNDAIEKIETSIRNYRRFADITFEFSEAGERILGVTISQNTAPSKVLTAEELNSRAVAVFEGLLPEGFGFVVAVKPFMP